MIKEPLLIFGGMSCVCMCTGCNGSTRIKNKNRNGLEENTEIFVSFCSAAINILTSISALSVSVLNRI